MAWALYVDPGSKHVGYSRWTDEGSGVWRCDYSLELSPDLFDDWLLANIWNGPTVPDEIGIEGFRLEGGLGALRQAGQTLRVIEVIGSLRLTARSADIPIRFTSRDKRAAALARASAVGYRWRARGHGPHAKDAEAVAIAIRGLDAEGIRTASVA